ncbi:unnamed protein product [Lampetra planeri]
MPSSSADRMVPSPGARCSVNFSGPTPAGRLSHTGPSWADRVKCSQSASSSSQPLMTSVDKTNLPNPDGLSGLLAPEDSGAEGGLQGMATSAPRWAEAPMTSVKLERVLDPTELSTPQSMAEVLAKKEELADRLEKANEEAIASAIAEEEQLTREIQSREQ